MAENKPTADHILTAQDLENNPSLLEEGLKEGETITLKAFEEAQEKTLADLEAKEQAEEEAKKEADAKAEEEAKEKQEKKEAKEVKLSGKTKKVFPKFNLGQASNGVLLVSGKECEVPVEDIAKIGEDYFNNKDPKKKNAKKK